MNTRSHFHVFLCFCVLLFFTNAVAARPIEGNFYSATAEQRQTPAGSLLKIIEIKPPAFFRAKAWRILYNTRDVFGRPILSSGVVIMSTYAPRDVKARKIVAWAHPTTGIGRNCAPSLKPWPGADILGINEMISAGYIIVATDYPGLGTVGPVGYLVGKGQGQAVIDAVRAAQKIPGISRESKAILWGYSQGGHAVQFAAHLASRYAPEVKFIGMVAVAPPTNLAQLLVEDMGTMEGRILSSYVIKSWAAKFSTAIDTLVHPKAVNWVNSVSAACVNSLDGQIKAFEAQGKLKDRFFVANPLKVSPWRELIRDNSLGSFSALMPNLVFQGGQDRVVSPSVTSAAVRNSCRADAVVKLVTLQGKGHGSSAKASVPEAMAWMADRFAGKPAPSSCR